MSRVVPNGRIALDYIGVGVGKLSNLRRLTNLSSCASITVDGGSVLIKKVPNPNLDLIYIYTRLRNFAFNARLTKMYPGPTEESPPVNKPQTNLVCGRHTLNGAFIENPSTPTALKDLDLAGITFLPIRDKVLCAYQTAEVEEYADSYTGTTKRSVKIEILLQDFDFKTSKSLGSIVTGYSSIGPYINLRPLGEADDGRIYSIIYARKKVGSITQDVLYTVTETPKEDEPYIKQVWPVTGAIANSDKYSIMQAAPIGRGKIGMILSQYPSKSQANGGFGPWLVNDNGVYVWDPLPPLFVIFDVFAETVQSVPLASFDERFDPANWPTIDGVPSPAAKNLGAGDVLFRSSRRLIYIGNDIVIFLLVHALTDVLRFYRYNVKTTSLQRIVPPPPFNGFSAGTGLDLRRFEYGEGLTFNSNAPGVFFTGVVGNGFQPAFRVSTSDYGMSWSAEIVGDNEIWESTTPFLYSESGMPQRFAYIGLAAGEYRIRVFNSPLIDNILLSNPAFEFEIPTRIMADMSDPKPNWLGPFEENVNLGRRLQLLYKGDEDDPAPLLQGHKGVLEKP